MKNPAPIPVVAGVFSRWNSKDREPEVLLFQRAAEDIGGGHWEFPGGKVELGESDTQALRRELEEEIAIPVRVRELVGKSLFQSPQGKVFELRLYFVEGSVDQIHLYEHQGLKWVSPSTLVLSEVAEGDRPLMEGVFQQITRNQGQS